MAGSHGNLFRDLAQSDFLWLLGLQLPCASYPWDNEPEPAFFAKQTEPSCENTLRGVGGKGR